VAKGGGKGRNYVRDGRGRFASTPGGGGSSSSNKPARKGRSASTGRPQPRTFRQRGQAQLDRRPGQGGYLGKATKEAKARLKASKAKLKAKPSAQQRAAVTRAQIRAEGASPVTRLKRSATPGVLKGVKVTRAKGARGKGAPTPATPPKERNPLARMAIIGRKRVRLTGRLINMDARSPVQFTPPPRNQSHIFSSLAGGKHTEANKKAAEKWVRDRGVNFERKVTTGKQKTWIAYAHRARNTIGVNDRSDWWMFPVSKQRRLRKIGWHSSSSPMAVLWHELGHIRDKRMAFRWQEAVNSSTSASGRTKRYKSFDLAANPSMPKAARKRRGKEMQALAGRVSRYATTSPSEFIAETYAGLRTGRKYDREVMRAYREAMGLPAKPPARLRSRLPRRRKPAS